MGKTKLKTDDKLREKLFDMLEGDLPYYLKQAFSETDKNGEPYYEFPVDKAECDALIKSFEIDVVSIRSKIDTYAKYSTSSNFDPRQFSKNQKAFGGKMDCIAWLELYGRLLEGGEGNSPAEIIDEMKTVDESPKSTDAQVRDLEYRMAKLNEKCANFQHCEFAAKMAVLLDRDWETVFI